MGKAPDLIFRTDGVQHQAFLLALNEHGIAFNGNDTAIPHNTLVGIEIETTDDTVRNNFTKDRAAGLTHIVFATMPKFVQRITQLLLSLHEPLDGIIVIDALRLLDSLRKDQPHG